MGGRALRQGPAAVEPLGDRSVANRRYPDRDEGGCRELQAQRVAQILAPELRRQLGDLGAGGYPCAPLTPPLPSSKPRHGSRGGVSTCSASSRRTSSPPQMRVKADQGTLYRPSLRSKALRSGRTCRPPKEGKLQMPDTRRGMRGRDLAARLVGALLCAAVAYIHIKDQGGLPGEKDPAYMQVGYYAIEVTAVIAGVMLLTLRRTMTAWFLAMGVAAGPFIGLVLTRTTGLPGAMDDIGNWSETLGVVSLVVEGALFLLAAPLFVHAVRTQPSALLPAYPRGDASRLPSQRAEAATEQRASR